MGSKPKATKPPPPAPVPAPVTMESEQVRQAGTAERRRLRQLQGRSLTYLVNPLAGGSFAGAMAPKTRTGD
jgi:hypothetical protein